MSLSRNRYAATTTLSRRTTLSGAIVLLDAHRLLLDVRKRWLVGAPDETLRQQRRALDVGDEAHAEVHRRTPDQVTRADLFRFLCPLGVSYRNIKKKGSVYTILEAMESI